EIAAAAARAGLKFLVFTDHGDATRPPDRPVYRSGVLCLDAVEISTTGGHYIGIDLPAAPYPLGGDARDVVEDVKRLGGFGVAARRALGRRRRAREPRASRQRRSGREPLLAAASGLRIDVPPDVDPRAARPPVRG